MVARRDTSTGQEVERNHTSERMHPEVEGHVMTERNRREKINRRLIELSTIVPGLKKLNRATILADATRYVEELQQKIKALQGAATGGGTSTSLVKNICHDAGPSSFSSSSSSGAPAGRNPRPEIEVQILEKGVTLRIICGDAKGVVVRVLSEVEEGLHLNVTHANTMRSTACTVIITITAEVNEGFTLTSEEIIGRLNSVLTQCNTCTSTEDN